MVRFETKFNSESTSSINKMQMKKLTWLYVVCTLVFTLIGLCGVLFPEDGSDLAFGIGMMAFGILFFPLCFVLTRFIQRRIDNTMSILSDKTNESFEFTEDKIIIDTCSEGLYTAHTEASYKYIYKIVENRDTFFLYSATRS